MGKTETNDIEGYFEWWLNELIVAGYVHSYSRESKVFEVFPNYIAQRKSYRKTIDPKIETFALLQKTQYTYDYEILWNLSAAYIFYQPADFSNPNELQTLVYKDTLFYAHEDKGLDRWVSYVDVKPPSQAARFSGQLSSYHTFPLKQAALLWLHGVYVNKVIPIPMSGAGKTISLFPNSFTPKRYLITDGATRTRSIKFKIRTLAKYVMAREGYINSIVNQQKKIRAKKIEQGDLFQ